MEGNPSACRHRDRVTVPDRVRPAVGESRSPLVNGNAGIGGRDGMGAQGQAPMRSAAGSPTRSRAVACGGAPQNSGPDETSWNPSAVQLV